MINTNALGKLFAAAGLAGLPFTWGSDGSISFGESITQDQRNSINAVVAGYSQLASNKADKWEDIKAKRDALTENGGYKVGTKWFHSDQKSRSQQLGLVLLGANIPASLQWKTMDGSFVTMTQQLAGQVLAAAAASDQAIFAAAEAHRQAMEVSADPAAYDFSTGWPKVFGE